MKVLLVKLSSLGDVLHTLPALTDAVAALPDISFDWVIEEAFSEVATWHTAIDHVVTVGLRRGRKNPIAYLRSEQWRDARLTLRESQYDVVIDAQGLLKSAFITRLASAPRVGLDKYSVRERLASLAYDEKISVARNLHAVERIRLLFARALNYELPEVAADFGLRDFEKNIMRELESHQRKRIMFIHGASRADKLWPEARWAELARAVSEAGYQVVLPWGSAQEKARAEAIVQGSGCPGLEILAKTTLTQLAVELGTCAAFVGVDTGPAHLAAALDVPGIALYGATDPQLVGTYGKNQHHVCALEPREFAPMKSIAAGAVWQALESILPNETIGPAPAGSFATEAGK